MSSWIFKSSNQEFGNIFNAYMLIPGAQRWQGKTRVNFWLATQNGQPRLQHLQTPYTKLTNNYNDKATKERSRLQQEPIVLNKLQETYRKLTK